MAGNISTRAGDKGRTCLGGGARVDKDDVRVECLGDLDEANSAIGLLRSKLENEHPWVNGLLRIQTEMMNLMAHVATPSKINPRPQSPLPVESSAWMEVWMEEIETSLTDATDHFLLPGDNDVCAHCQMARTITRRAERRLVALHKVDPVDPSILQFVNRLSDLFFKLCRQESYQKGLSEERWRRFSPNQSDSES